MEVDREFQPDSRTSKDFELFGVAWRYNEIWYAISVADCVFSTSPADLFGYQSLGFDPHNPYDEELSGESGLDANTASKATPGNGKATQSSQGKDPVGKVVKGTTQTIGLLAMAPKARKPIAALKVPRTSHSVTSLRTESTSATVTTSSSPKASHVVAKVTSTSGTRMKAMPPSSRNVVPLPLSATSKLRRLRESKTTDDSPGKSVSDRTRKKSNTSEIR